MVRVRSSWVVVAVLAGAVLAARAEVDAEIGGNLKAKGSIAPSGEVESFTFPAVQGTLLTAAAKGRGGLVPSLRLFDPDGAEVVPLPGFLSVAGTKAQIRKLPLGRTGSWRLDLSGEGTGDYSLTLKAVPPRKAGDTLDVPGLGSAEFAFAAPAGSILSLGAKGARGSGAVPRLGLLAADGGGAIDLADQGKIGPTSHAASTTAPGEGGDLNLTIVNGSEAGGEVIVSVKIKAPKAAREKLDLRGSALGSPGGGETFVARFVDSGGGTVEVPAGTGNRLAGTRLVVPEGALESRVPISIRSAAAPPPPTANDQSAGPAVDLQPSGLTFAETATLTLPFDPALLPANRSPEDIRVLVVEGNGSTFEITPTSTDAEAGTVSLPLNGFSICIPVVRSGLPRLGVAPGGDEFWNLTLEYELIPPETGNDSRARYFLQEVGETSFYADGTVQTSSSWRTVSFSNDAAPGGYASNLQAFEFPQDYAATWQYGADGRTIEIQEGDGGPVMAVSRDGSVLLEHSEDTEEYGIGWSVMLRKNASPLTQASLTGTWWVAGFELSVDQQGFDGPASVRVQRQFGSIAFDGKGGAKIAAKERKTRVDGGSGNLVEESESFTGTATYQVQEDGTILLTIPPEDGDDQADILRVYPGRDADVMFLADDGPCGSCTFAMLLVRQGSGLSTAVLDGDYMGSAKAVEIEPYAPDAGEGGLTQPMGDVRLSAFNFTAPFDGGASASLDGVEHRVQRSMGSPDGVSSVAEPYDTPVTIAVDPKGKFTLSPPGVPGYLTGAVSPDGMFVVLLTEPANPGAELLFGFALKSPPASEP